MADAEAKSLQALAEAKASALSKEQAEAQAVAALAEARALVLVKDEAEVGFLGGCLPWPGAVCCGGGGVGEVEGSQGGRGGVRCDAYDSL